MKIVLVQPPVQDFYDTDIRLQPIGLCYLKAAVNKYLPEVDVIIKDYHSGHGRKTIPVPKELAYLLEYYPVADKSPFSLFHQYYHFGKSFSSIEEDIADLNPDIVGISSLFTPYYREALEIASRVKARLDVPVVMGGSHISGVPESVLSHPSVDYVIRGEGERPLVEFIEYFRKDLEIDEVSGLGYKKNGVMYFNPVRDNYPVNELPFPDLGGFSLRQYEVSGKPLAFMITSRGCPHRCNFCSVHSTFGNRYRVRTVVNVLEEIEERYREGYRIIDFEDDNLTFHRNEFMELCRRLIKRFPDREMGFAAMNGISYMNLDDELLELMFHAGFSKLNISLVSTDGQVRDSATRPHTLEAYVKVVNKAFQLGFKTISYQILGLPYENLASMIKTLAFHASLPVLIGVSPFYLTPDAPLARGLNLNDEDYIRARLTAMAVETDQFTREDIYTLFITARIINFLKGLDIPLSMQLDVLLQQAWSDNRISTGIELLRKLIKTGTLYFRTSKGDLENNRFRSELFFRVLREIKNISCLNGEKISV